MANVLRYQTGGRSFVAGLEPLADDDEFSAERYGMPAPQNSTGILERNVAPGTADVTARGQFQLASPGDLQLPERDATPRLGALTLPNAPDPRFDGSETRRLSMVEGMPETEPAPTPPGKPQASALAMPTNQGQNRDERTAMRRIGIMQMIAGVLGVGPRTQGAFDAARGRVDDIRDQRIQAGEAQAQAQREAEQQAYERDFANQRLELEGRRIAQAEGATSQDTDRAAAMYDPTHPAAQSARIAYARLYRAIPPSALPQLAAFAPDRALQGMSAMDIRQQAASLTQAWGRLQQANPNLFRVGRRSTGGRGARNGLAGLGSPGRTVDYGVSEGLTPEDWQALGVDPTQFGGDVAPEEQPAEAMPPAAQQPPPPSTAQPRQAPPQGQPMGGMRPVPAQRAAAPQAAAQAPQGRPLIDRPMTDEELAQATPEVRRTQLLAQAQQRRAIGMSWPDAVATVQGFQPAERDRLMAEYGNEGANRIPGWRRVRDTGVLPPTQYTDMRETVTQARQIRANARRIQQIAREVQALNLAEDQLRGHPLVTEWRSLARRIQTALRVIDRTGVPTGNEQERAMQEAPEPDSLQALMRASTAYATLPDAIDRNVWQYMDTLGYRPEGRRRGEGQ